MLLRAVVAAAPADTTIAAGSIEGIPLYNADVDAAGPVAAVRDLKEQIAASDGVLLVSPEYNHSVPGVLKNAIDWVSRPVTDIPRVFGDRPVGVIGATSGAGGTTLAQVANAATVFDEQGTLRDAAVRSQIDQYLAGFVRFVARNRR